MKKTLLLTCFSLFFYAIHAQWIHINGDTTLNASPAWGEKGVPSPLNWPGGRQYSGLFTDQSDNLWLFGGGANPSTGPDYLNDLWRYDTKTKDWTWVNGDSTAAHPAVYGIKSQPSASNRPGGIFSPITWTDACGNFWLFGGFGYSGTGFGFLNTLWKYSPGANQWTWVAGDSLTDISGHYGIKGVAGSGGYPGARYGSATWFDQKGVLWLYGGYGWDGASTGVLADLWNYDTYSGQWTWVSGDTLIDQPQVFGPKGDAGHSYRPGSRYLSASWMYGNDKLYVFGGYGQQGNSQGELNTLWVYDKYDDTWTWLTGDSVISPAAVYGSKRVGATGNTPGGRYPFNAVYDNNGNSGNAFIFGGFGRTVNNRGYLNDLWSYNCINNLWTWQDGDSSVGSPFNLSTPLPSGRASNCLWRTQNGTIYVYGGLGYDEESPGLLQDMYRYIGYGGTKDDVVKTSSLKFYPNPCRDYITIELGSDDESVAGLTISTINGEPLYAKKEQLHKGLNQIKVPVKQASGVYLVTVRWRSGHTNSGFFTVIR